MPKQSSAGGRLSRGNNIPARSARKRLSVLEKSQALSKALTSQRGREVLLDTALSVFDECHRESERDKNAARFVDNTKQLIAELRLLMPAISDFKGARVIGRGRFGEIRIVRQLHTGLVFALKTINKEEVLSQYQSVSIQEEKDVMTSHKSPFLVTCHMAVQDITHLHMVMDFVAGGDMLSHLRRQECSYLPEEDVRFYTSELVTAVNAVHQLGYVHRDVKPENILISADGHIKLCDFGSVVKLDADGKVRGISSGGTPDYSAPELVSCVQGFKTSADGDDSFVGVQSYDHKADWWSVGITMFEMLVGHVPRDKRDDSIANLGKMFSGTRQMSPKQMFDCTEVHLSDAAKSLLTQLVCDSTDRLDITGIHGHEFFSEVDWSDLLSAIPPWIPVLSSTADTSYFDQFDDLSSAALPLPTPQGVPRRGISSHDLPFAGFSHFPWSGSSENSAAETMSPVTVDETNPGFHLTTSTPTATPLVSPISKAESSRSDVMLTPASKGTTSATKDGSGGSGGSRRTLKRQHSMTATSPPPRPVAPDNQDGLLCVPSLSVSSQHHDSSMTFGSSTLQLRIIDLTSDVAGKDDVINILRDQLAECQEQLETAKQQRKQAERAGEEHRISNELASAKLTEMTEQLAKVTAENKSLSSEVARFLSSKREWDKEKQAVAEQTSMELSVVQNLAERERANNTKRMAFKEAELTESKASNRELRCRVSALEKRLQSKSSEALSSLDDLRTRLSDVASASKERIGSLQSELSKALEERAALVDDLGRAQDTVQTLEDDKRKLNEVHASAAQQLTASVETSKAECSKLQKQVLDLSKLVKSTEDHNKQVVKLEELLLGKAQCCADLMARVSTLEDQLETIRGDKHAVESAKWTLEEENKKLADQISQFAKLRNASTGSTVSAAPSFSPGLDSATPSTATSSSATSTIPRFTFTAEGSLSTSSSVASQTQCRASSSMFPDMDDQSFASSVASEVSEKQKELFLQQQESISSLQQMCEQLVRRIDENKTESISQQETTKMSFHLELRQQLAEAQKQVGASEENRKNLEAEVEQLARELRMKTRELKSEKSSWSAAEEKLQARLEYLRSELRATRDEARTARRDLSSALNKQQKVTSDYDTLKLETTSRCTDLEERLATSEASCQELHEALDAAKARVSVLEQAEVQTERLLVETRQLQGSRQALKEQIGRLEDSKVELAAWKANAEKRLDEQHQRLESGELTIQLMKETATTLETQVDDWEILHDEVSEREKKAQKQLEDLRRDLLTSEESLGEVQALLDTEKASHEKTRSDLAAVSRDLQQTAERCGQLDSQLATALEQITTGQQQCQNLLHEKQCAEKRISEEVERNRLSEDEAFKIRRHLSIEQASVTKLQGEVTKLRSEISQMAEAQARLTEEIEARTTDEVRLKEVSYQQLKLINFLQDQNDASMTLSATKGAGRTPSRRARADSSIPRFQRLSSSRADGNCIPPSPMSTSTQATTNVFLPPSGPADASSVSSRALRPKSSSESISSEYPAAKRKKHGMPKLLESMIPRIHRDNYPVSQVERHPSSASAGSGTYTTNSPQYISAACLAAPQSSQSTSANSTPTATAGMEGSLAMASFSSGGAESLTWKECYVVLSGIQLLCYRSEAEATRGMPAEVFPLFSIQEQDTVVATTLKRNVFTLDLPSASTQDRQLSFTIASPALPDATRGTTHRRVTLKCPDRRAKTRWVRALQSVLSSTPSEDQLASLKNGRCGGEDDDDDMTLESQVVVTPMCSLMTCTSSASVTSAVYICEQTWLIGTTHSGLLLLRPSGNGGRFVSSTLPTQFSSVHQLLHLEDSQIIVIVAGDDRCVYLVQQDDVLSLVDSTISMTTSGSADKLSTSSLTCIAVERCEGCHTIAVGQVDNVKLLAVATEKQIVVYSLRNSLEFKMLKEIAPPLLDVHCLLISPLGLVVVGGNDVHILSQEATVLSDFIQESARLPEMSDSRVLKAFFLPALNEEDDYEILVCYQTFAVFLSGNGHSSRNIQLTWNQPAKHFNVHGTTLLVDQPDGLQFFNLLSGKSGLHSGVKCPTLIGDSAFTVAMATTSAPSLLLSDAPDGSAPHTDISMVMTHQARISPRLLVSKAGGEEREGGEDEAMAEQTGRSRAASFLTSLTRAKSNSALVSKDNSYTYDNDDSGLYQAIAEQKENVSKSSSKRRLPFKPGKKLFKRSTSRALTSAASNPKVSAISDSGRLQQKQSLDAIDNLSPALGTRQSRRNTAPSTSLHK